MLNWVKRFNIFCYLDNHHYSLQPHRYECVLGAGAWRFVDDTHGLDALDRLLAASPDWTLGHLSYNLKNRWFPAPEKADPVGFPHFFFFQPEILITLRDNELTIRAAHPQQVYAELLAAGEADETPLPSLELQQRFSRDAYLERVRQLQQHILRGDCYEINFCQEFFAESVSLDPVSLFQKLVAVSPVPFSALYRLHDRYLVCASPERFLLKEGNRLLSQPMKGTARRHPDDPHVDAQVQHALFHDAKERAENVMVVDLVRNDLSRICAGASVQVEELFGIYSFPQVHQMVSTVTGELKEGVTFSSIVEATFPMGSMTGAPKKRVMELIDRYEAGARGLFSGSVGYIDAQGDFDFNVVIRSVLYHAGTGYLSYQVGSGITWYSQAEKEWEECQLKAMAIKKVLTG
ncbi:anthranilate synthase component I family protein [Paraflavisolibacter sp. H34]|uniref:anthranilate synthase component I family protein n=1 Tax=Huijunlia imazamoxiresistens TaxID=3127457 RepID=UPI003018FB52